MRIRTLAATASLALSACSSEFSAVNIFEICAPPTPDATGTCLYPATCAASLAGVAVLDVTTAKLDFRLPVQIDNTLVNNASAVDGRINTNDAYIQSFEMTYTGASLAPWSISAAVTVPAAGSAGAVLRLIPVAYFPSIAPPGSATTNIVVNVRGHGVLGSQNSFTTAWYQVPVAVCSGCLAASLTCAPPALVASCPSSASLGTMPGQTANLACVTL